MAEGAVAPAEAVAGSTMDAREAVRAQQLWLENSLNRTSLMIDSRKETPRGDTQEPRASVSHGGPAAAEAAGAPITHNATLAPEAEVETEPRCRPLPPTLDEMSAQIDREARIESVRVQQGWMASLMAQISISFSPRDSRRPSLTASEAHGSYLITPTHASPVASPPKKGEPARTRTFPQTAEERATDQASRDEAVRVQQGWLASLLSAMATPRNEDRRSDRQSDGDPAMSAAPPPSPAATGGTLPRVETEEDRAARAEALRSQQGWLAGLMHGMRSFAGASSQELVIDEDEAVAAGRPPSPANKTGPGAEGRLQESEMDRAARAEALLSQQGWLANLLYGMRSFEGASTDALDADGRAETVAAKMGPREETDVDRKARVEALRSQQGWLAGLLMGMRSYEGGSTDAIDAVASPRRQGETDQDRAARWEAVRSQREWLAKLLMGTNHSSDVLLEPPGPPGESDQDKAARLEALHSQRVWLANLLMGSGESDELLDETGGPPGESEADRAARLEALHSQRAWLANLMLSTGDSDWLEKAEGPPGESEEDRVARLDALRAQRAWLANLMQGMGDSDSLDDTEGMDKAARLEALLAQRAWLAGLMAGLGVSLDMLENEGENDADKAARIEALRSQRAWLAALLVAMSPDNSTRVSARDDEEMARAWELEQTRLALEAAQREADAFDTIKVFPRLPPAPESSRDDASNAEYQTGFVPDMKVYNRLARKQGWRICPHCESGCDVCFPDGSGICASCSTRFRWASAEPLVPPQTLAEVRRETKLRHTEMLAHLHEDEKLTIQMAASRYWLEASADCSTRAKASLHLYRAAIALPLALSLPILKKRAEELRNVAESAAMTEKTLLTPTIAHRASKLVHERYSSPLVPTPGWQRLEGAGGEASPEAVVLTPNTHDGRKMFSQPIIVANPRRAPNKARCTPTSSRSPHTPIRE